MGYAVLHVQKGSGSGSALGNHIDRIEGKEHTFKNADPKLRELNHNVEFNKYCKLPFAKAISERISDGYKNHRKMRTDAVKYCTVILSGSHIDMKRIERNPDQFANWVNDNMKFASEQWGTENIVRFSVHLDEKTPHIHCVFVPLTEDGRLSAKEVLGNKKKFEALQDSYGIQMKDYKLKRGLRGSKAKHETVSEYYGRLERVENPETNKKDFEALDQAIQKPSTSDILSPGSYAKKIKEKAAKALKEILEKADREKKVIENENRELKKELAKVKGHLYTLHKDFGELNSIPYKVKINPGQISFISEGEMVSMSSQNITKHLDKQKFETGIEKLLKTIPVEVTNAHFQLIKNNYNLLEKSPKELSKLALRAVNLIMEHSDTQRRQIKGKAVDIEFSFERKENDLHMKMKYTNSEGKLVQRSKTVDRLDNILRNINDSLINEQLRKNRGMRR